jgi:hypothetical protein
VNENMVGGTAIMPLGGTVIANHLAGPDRQEFATRQPVTIPHTRQMIPLMTSNSTAAKRQTKAATRTVSDSNGERISEPEQRGGILYALARRDHHKHRHSVDLIRWVVRPSRDKRRCYRTI